MEAWLVEQRRAVLRRLPFVSVFRETVRLPGGRLIDDFYTIELRDFVVVTALTDAGSVVAERLYRHGPATITWALPAGYVDAGELPLGAARRELLEETGYEAAQWRSLGRFVVDGNRGCGWCHCFLATGAARVADPSSDDLAEVEVAEVDATRMLEYVANGEVAELATAAGLALAMVHLNGDSRSGLG